MRAAEALATRPFEAGDEEAILDLFAKAFGRDLPREFWTRRFLGNPTGRVLIELMWGANFLVGHYAASPAVVSTPRGDALTALSMTTMTHPDFQGRGVFRELAERLYARMASEGFACVWGFPNNNSHRGFIRDLKWVDISEIPTLTLDLAKYRVAASASRLERLRQFDARFDELWARIRTTDERTMTRRDQAYLSWRYATVEGRNYVIYGVLGKGDRLDAYAVTKRYGDGVDIVDILAVSPAVGELLINGIASEASAAGATSVQLWLNVRDPLHGALERIGFENREPVTYFGGRMLSSTSWIALDASRWYVTMGDSDVY